MKNYLNNSRNQQHPFHLVDPSPWPFYVSVSLLHILVYLVTKMEKGFCFCVALFVMCHSYGFILAVIRWFNDIIVEATFEGQHTKKVQKGLYLGMLLFIISEAMFFFSFFWAFFYLSLNPSIEYGSVWPPTDITPISPFSLPLVNTLLLLASGISITFCHRLMIYGNNHKLVSNFLLITILWGVLFTEVQIYEYMEAPFSIRDGVYGSIFYICTGFHGFHVLMGTLFLIVCLLRQNKFHFTKEHHVGFEAAAWYWHFVDVVWLFLFVCIYWWGF